MRTGLLMKMITVFGLLGGVAFASTSKEVFSATESDSTTPAVLSTQTAVDSDAVSTTVPTSKGKGKSKRTAKTADVETRLISIEKELQAMKAEGKKGSAEADETSSEDKNNAAQAKIASYEAVPEAQRLAIIKRLKVAAKLVEKGRAYDYRNMTTSELELILESLK